MTNFFLRTESNGTAQTQLLPTYLILLHFKLNLENKIMVCLLFYSLKYEFRIQLINFNTKSSFVFGLLKHRTNPNCISLDQIGSDLFKKISRTKTHHLYFYSTIQMIF